MFILEHCTCCPGKGLEGDFVYGWDGTDLVLLPTNSPDYVEIEQYSKRINNRKIFTGKDLIIGATYLTKDNEEWIYMGRFDKWKCCSKYYGRSSYYRYEWSSKEVDDSWIKDSYINNAYKNENKGRHYWFIYPDAKWKSDRIKIFRSLSSKIIDVINEECVQNYTDLYEELEKESSFSPVDYSNDEVFELSYESFVERTNRINEWPNYIKLYSETYHKFVELYYGEYYNDQRNPDKKWYIKYYDDYSSRYFAREQYKEYTSVREAYDDIRPLERKRYLANGNIYQIGW